jgi:hypothetical protein
MLCRTSARADTSGDFDSANDAPAFGHKDTIGRFLA